MPRPIGPGHPVSSRMPATFDIIRDPLWDNIQVDQAGMAVLDTPAMQRLRYVRQLGHAFLVYPGATNTRFEHALGAWHLTGRALAILGQRGELHRVSPMDQQAVRLAAMLHDIGHYPFSHGLEEAGFPHHEGLSVRRLSEGALGQVLRAQGGEPLIAAIGDLIQGRSRNPLQGLISGTLDLDKIDYLSRDARACGVPYGALDVDRLLSSLTLVDTEGGATEVGILEKGVSSLESLLFAKYQMYRNVYWHHAVRSATCMFKRAVRSVAASGQLAADTIAEATDGALVERLLVLDPSGLSRAVHERRLFKRALDLPASEVPGSGEWLDADPALVERVEDAVAMEAGLAPSELLIDFPARPTMLAVDIALSTRDGRVERLTEEGRAGHLGLPRIGAELYRSARRLRVFTARPPRVSMEPVVDLMARSAAEVRERLESGRALL